MDFGYVSPINGGMPAPSLKHVLSTIPPTAASSSSSSLPPQSSSYSSPGAGPSSAGPSASNVMSPMVVSGYDAGASSLSSSSAFPPPPTPGGAAAGAGPAPQKNTLAAKTASLANPQTLFQQCSDVKRRLRHVAGYEKYIDVPNARDYDTMHLVWRSLRLGSSLCHLLNLYLGPDDTPITYDEPDFAFDGRNGVFTWAEQNLKRCQRPAAHFIMRMKELQGQDRWPKSDALWALHELFIDDTGCLVKVLKTVGALLDGLPATAWRHASPATTPHHHQASSSSAAAGAANTASPGVNIIGGGVNVPAPYDRPGSSASTYFPGHPSHLSSGSLSLAREFPIPPTPGRQPLSINTNVVDASGGSRGPPTGGPPPPAQPLPPPELDFGPVSIGRAAMHVWEILKTEKKYVQDLEVLQAYSQEVLHSGILTADSVHLMFSNLTKLVDFQRRFLLSLETEYEPFVEKGGHAWIEGRWGKPFLKHEHDFAVYDPYCANYIQAIDLVEKEAATLSRHNLSLTVPELTSYLVIPVQRLCRYPMLLEALVKSSDKTDYEYKPELAHGYAVAKRIADGVNETLRQHQNLKTVRELAGRVKDWKNHDIADFGALLLDGRFNVTKGDVERDYEVYLFEKMILCCKEIVPEKVKDKRSKSGSILKKQSISGQPAVPPVKNMLSLKGRIYVNNLTHIEHESKNGDYALRVFWRSQENPMEFEHFVLHVKNSEQLAKWESKITSLMRADQSRREQRERERRGRNYVSPASNFPITPANEQGPYGENELRRGSSTSTAWDEEGTPSTTASSHRPIRASERYSSHSIRNSTDDQHVLPSHLRYQQVVGVPPVPMQRLQSTQSLEPTRKAHRGMSDDTYGPSLASSSTDDQQEFLRSVAAEGGRGVNYQSPALRMRSASSPNVYGVGAVDSQPSPASSTVNGGGGVGGWTSQSQTYADYNPSKVSLAAHSDGPHSDFGFKRSSNSSNATDVSEASTPDTPYEGAVLAAALPSLAEHVTTENVIVKVRYYDDVYKLSVPSSISYDDLYTKVSRKIQMCRGVQPGSQIKCYYTDEEDERLRLTGDDDLPYLLEPVLTGQAREVEIEVKV